MTKRRQRTLTARSILQPRPVSTMAEAFLTRMRASGLRGKALKEHAELERQRLAEIRLANRLSRAKSNT